MHSSLDLVVSGTFFFVYRHLIVILSKEKGFFSCNQLDGLHSRDRGFCGGEVREKKMQREGETTMNIGTTNPRKNN